MLLHTDLFVVVVVVERNKNQVLPALSVKWPTQI